jgi:transposase-like protein
MDLPRRIYSRELKRAVMIEMDAGSSAAAAARKYQLSPKLLEKWRCDWRAKGELAFPGNGQKAEAPVLDQNRKIGELERKIGQLTMENEFLKKALRHFKAHPLPAAVGGADAYSKKSIKPRRKEKP